jgi:ATP-dependent helicase HrpA
MILQGAHYGVLDDVLVLASALEIQDVRERPRDQESKADQAHRRFRDETSDFVGLLKLWAFIDEAARQGSGQLRRVCKDNYLSQRRVREWREVHRQLASTVRELKLDDPGDKRGRNHSKLDLPGADPAGLDHTAKVHCALLSGLLSRVGQYNAEKRVFFGARQTRFVVHPSSSLAKKPPAWIMAFELVETTQLFARATAKVEPEWFALVAEHLLKRTYSDPHWSEKSARAVIKEHATLFGLQVLKDRTVDYATVAPGRARLIFLEHALVRGEYSSAGAFQQANRNLLDEVAQLRNKARRSDLLSDEEALLSFFDKRVPNGVVNGKTFEAWREQDEKQAPRRLFLSLSDVLLADEHLDPADCPDELTFGSAKLPLLYRFEPTQDNDGITILVPLAEVPRLDPALFDWTIPAWHETKLTELLLRLPKATQRKLGNITTLASKLAEQLKPFSEPFVLAVERAVRQLTGTPLSAGDLRPDLLPGYLRFTVQIIGVEGKVLAEGRDVAALFTRFGASARTALAEVSSTEWRRKNVKGWDFGKLPTSVTERVLGSNVELYPALCDRGTSIELALVSSPEEALIESRRGLLRLALLAHDRTLTTHEKALPKSLEPLTVTVSPIGHSSAQRERFRRVVVERAMLEALTLPVDMPRTQAAFEEWTKAALPRLERTLASVLQVASAVNGELRETRTAVAQTAKQPSGAAALRDITLQMDQLFPDDMLLHVSLNQLAHFPRYLKGIRVRLGRAVTDPRKDADKAAPITPLWQLFQAKLPMLPLEQASQVRWLFEELRIATFAPELKPAVPVSIAKLKMALE